jgi:hypothetical protein
VADLGATLKVRVGLGVRLQIEQRRAPAAYREADLRVEEAAARRPDPAGLGEQQLEAGSVEIAADDAVTVMVDEAVVDEALLNQKLLNPALFNPGFFKDTLLSEGLFTGFVVDRSLAQLVPPSNAAAAIPSASVSFAPMRRAVAGAASTATMPTSSQPPETTGSQNVDEPQAGYGITLRYSV